MQAEWELLLTTIKTTESSFGTAPVSNDNRKNCTTMQKTKVTPTKSIKSIRRLYTGDNLPVMRSLPSESIDLIATDGPFNSKREYVNPIAKRSRYAGEMAGFSDTWRWDADDANWLFEIEAVNPELAQVIRAASVAHGDKPKSSNHMGAFLCFYAIRLIEAHRLLKPTDSLYLHLDPTASHYMKLVLDCIF